MVEPNAEPRVDGRSHVAMLLLAALYWSLVEASAVLQNLLRGVPYPVGDLLGEIATVASATGLSFVVYAALQWVSSWRLVARIAVAVALIAGASVGYALALRLIATVYSVVLLMVERLSWRTVAVESAYWLSYFALWTMIVFVVLHSRSARIREARLARFQARSQAAELRALRYQVNPHLLFNSFNALATLLLDRRNDDAERMLLALSNYYRWILTTALEEDVPLGAELDMQLVYLSIERQRFADQLAVEIDVAEEARLACVPSMILQPLVENAVKHGVGASDETASILIRADVEAGRLRVLIENSVSAGRAHQPAASTGTGLRNVRERLATRFGAGQDFEAGSPQPGHYRVRFTIPFSRCEERRRP